MHIACEGTSSAVSLRDRYCSDRYVSYRCRAVQDRAFSLLGRDTVSTDATATPLPPLLHDAHDGKSVVTDLRRGFSNPEMPEANNPPSSRLGLRDDASSGSFLGCLSLAAFFLTPDHLHVRSLQSRKSRGPEGRKRMALRQVQEVAARSGIAMTVYPASKPSRPFSPSPGTSINLSHGCTRIADTSNHGRKQMTTRPGRHTISQFATSVSPLYTTISQRTTKYTLEHTLPVFLKGLKSIH